MAEESAVETKEAKSPRELFEILSDFTPAATDDYVALCGVCRRYGDDCGGVYPIGAVCPKFLAKQMAQEQLDHGLVRALIERQPDTRQVRELVSL